jgi:hypothetical protein
MEVEPRFQLPRQDSMRLCHAPSLEFVFPEAPNRKAHFPQGPSVSLVTSAVSGQFRMPIFRIRFWLMAMFRATVEETPVREDCRMQARDNHVGLSWKGAHVFFYPPLSAQGFPD